LGDEYREHCKKHSLKKKSTVQPEEKKPRLFATETATALNKIIQKRGMQAGSKVIVMRELIPGALLEIRPSTLKYSHGINDTGVELITGKRPKILNPRACVADTESLEKILSVMMADDTEKGVAREALKRDWEKLKELEQSPVNAQAER
jgi:hypothetical protein